VRQRNIIRAGLTPSDATFDGKAVAMNLGVATRGETTTTGTNEGVVISRGWIAEGLLVIMCKCDPHSAVFAFTQAGFRDGFQKFFEKIGHSWVKAVHWSMHSGAASDVEQARRDLERVRKRGRWKHTGPCHRYTKTHVLVESRMKFGPEIVKEGAEFLADPRKMVVKAIQAGPGRHSSFGKALMRRVAEGPTLSGAIESVRPDFSPRLPSARAWDLPPTNAIADHLRNQGQPVPRTRRGKIKRAQELENVPIAGVEGDISSGEETIYDWFFQDGGLGGGEER